MSSDQFLKKFYSDQINHMGYSGLVPSNIQDLEKLYNSLKQKEDNTIEFEKKLRKNQNLKKIKGKIQKKKSRKKNKLQIALDEISKKQYEQFKNHPRKYKIRENREYTPEEIQSIIQKDQLTKINNAKQIKKFPLELLSEIDSIEGKGNLAKFRNNHLVDYLEFCDYFISHSIQDATDEQIASSTGREINMIRRVLYDLFGKGIIEGVRVLDEKKGYPHGIRGDFVYRWHSNKKKVRKFIEDNHLSSGSGLIDYPEFSCDDCNQYFGHQRFN